MIIEDVNKTSVKAFITSYTKEAVRFSIFHPFKQHRIAYIKGGAWGSPFKGVSLFKGKNITIEISSIPGTVIIRILESKKHKLIQKFNFYCLKRF